jgi:thioredoxin reductase (NADPH)
MQEISTNTLIIGAGPIGLFAVFMCGMMGIKTHVIEGLNFIGGQCQALYPEKPIYDIPGFPSITGQDLVDRLARQAEPFQPQFHLGCKADQLIQNKDHFTVTTSNDLQVHTKTILICAGAGAFAPKKPPLSRLEIFEEKSIFYHVKQKKDFAGKTVVIAGGGDSAVDWAIELSEIARKVILVHRRGQFRAQSGTLATLQNCFDKGSVILYAPYQLEGLEGQEGNLSHIILKDFSDQTLRLEADILLPFFGMASELGSLQDWGLDLEKNKILTHPTTFETSVPGIYAVGDVAAYDHKLKLIVTGFSEASSAAHHLRRHIWPDRLYAGAQHSTSTGLPQNLV